MTPISLYGFNNLTKNLSFSLYTLCYVENETENLLYKANLLSSFNSGQLTHFLTELCQLIGGNVLNVAKQDYQPHGASVTLMISEEETAKTMAQSIVTHIDKSHLCIHTYPDDAPQNKIAIFRADIELSTCGIISPLKVINTVLKHFNADVIEVDYRIRGMTRNKFGQKLYRDENISNISDNINTAFHASYEIINDNMPDLNLYHCKLIRSMDHLAENMSFSQKHRSAEKNEAITDFLYKEIQQLATQCN